MNLGRLEQITDLRDVWKTEAQDFTPWLAEEQNLTLLGETIGLDLELEAVEKDVGPFSADIVCKETANNSTVLIENQIERTDHTHLEEAHDLVLAECRRSRKTKLSTAVLDKVKAQIKGHLTLGMESMSGRMHRLGRQELLSGSRQSLAATIDQIDKVTPEELREAANLVIDESHLTITTLGPTPAGLFQDIANP